ncbi:MAG: hypothetical protein WAT67_04245 [Candidatus Contendobacter sp.]
MRLALSTLALIIGFGGAACAQSAYPIAGLTPSQRPAGAPVIKQFKKDRKWSENYYHGIAKPYPPHLDEASQGAWYTPFTRPGMIGPYDIRRWHQSQIKSQAKGKKA